MNFQGKMDVLHVLKCYIFSELRSNTGSRSLLAAVGELAYIQCSKINSQPIRYANAILSTGLLGQSVSPPRLPNMATSANCFMTTLNTSDNYTVTLLRIR